jgi:hypothetical protein
MGDQEAGKIDGSPVGHTFGLVTVADLAQKQVLNGNRERDAYSGDPSCGPHETHARPNPSGRS